MALYKGNKEIDLIYCGRKAISATFQGARMVWQAVRSCFGSGLWINDKPWINDEGWRNN